MTLEMIRAQARRYSRMEDTSLLTDAQLNERLQEAVTTFANDVSGFALTKNPAISAKFNTETFYAIRVTIVGGANALLATDVLITSTARSQTTGTIVAADFQTTLRAAVGSSLTVTWDDFKFTVDTLDATSITYASPSDVNYADARELLGITGSPGLSDFSHDGAFPEDCTLRYTLPTDMISIQRVEWDGLELVPLPREHVQSPESFGTPYWYHIRDRDLYFIPVPSRQEMCEVWYRGFPADIIFAGYQEAGLSGISDESNTGLAAQGWKYKVAINGSDATEFDITTTSTDTYAALITLMNAQNTGATWTLVDGDLRLTSDAVTGVSSIAVTAGSSVDLLAGLSITMETAVTGDTTPPSEIPMNYHKALPFLVAYLLLLEQMDDKLAGLRRAEYVKTMRLFRLSRLTRDTETDRNDGLRNRLGYTVTMP